MSLSSWLALATGLLFAIFAVVCIWDSVIDAIRNSIIRLGEKMNKEDKPYRIFQQNDCRFDTVNALKKRCKKDSDLKEKVEDKFRSWQIVHKELVCRRAFAYEYEEMIYKIFTYKNDKNHYVEIKKQKSFEVIKKISEIRHIPLDEAEKLFYLLDSKRVLDYSLRVLGSDEVYIGKILESGTTGWNIISDDDMNIQKWIYIQNKESN